MRVTLPVADPSPHSKMFTLQRKSPWFFLMGCVLGVPWAICWHYTRQLAHFYVWPFIIPFVIHSDPSYGRHILIYPSLPGMILSILTLIVANYGLQGGYSSRRMWIAFWLGLAFMMVLAVSLVTTFTRYFH